jgi:alanine racemase
MQFKDFPPEAHTSVITLSRQALKNNITYVKERIKGNTELAAVLKGNAYGHGIEPMTELCLKEGITTFCVFSAYEAYRVQQAAEPHNAAARIIIMGYISPDVISWAIESGIEMFVFNLTRLQEIAAVAGQSSRAAKIHIEVETGMNRTGFEKCKLEELARQLTTEANNIEVVGLCTHFAGAEEMANHLRIKHQHKTLKWWEASLQEKGVTIEQTHAVCSAGLLNYPKAQYDLVRVGIILYGFWPSLETRILQLRSKPDPLRRLMRWTTSVMSIKQVKLGEYIGYGTSFLATSDMTIALIPVGYAYGFSRSLSNNGRVLVQGKPAQVIGVVNMNLLIVNVTDSPEVGIGDEVVLIGTQGQQEISVASFSEMSQQLNYEMLTRLPTDIPRLIQEEYS